MRRCPGFGSRMLPRLSSSLSPRKCTLRFNADFFNVFNHPNNPTSIASTGILSTRNSGSGARTTQLGIRLMW